MKTSRALLGVAVGFTAGAIIGILFAPQSGTETRKKMVMKGTDLANDINNRIDRKFSELLRTLNEKWTPRRKPEAEVVNGSHAVS